MGCSGLERGCGRSFFFNAVQPGAEESPKMTAGPFREPAATHQMLYLRIAFSIGLRAAHECLPYLAFFCRVVRLLQALLLLLLLLLSTGSLMASSPSSLKVWCARRISLRAMDRAARLAPIRSLWCR